MLGTEPTAISACEPSTVRPSESVDRDAVAGARAPTSARELLRIVMPRSRKTRSMAMAASASSCGITRSRLETSVTLHAHGQVGAGELGAGHAGADHDQVLGQLGQVVDLAPVEDPLAVGHGGRAAPAGVAPVAISTVEASMRVLSVTVRRA